MPPEPSERDAQLWARFCREIDTRITEERRAALRALFLEHRAS
jgi:hypothetical protein